MGTVKLGIEDTDGFRVMNSWVLDCYGSSLSCLTVRIRSVVLVVIVVLEKVVREEVCCISFAEH